MRGRRSRFPSVLSPVHTLSAAPAGVFPICFFFFYPPLSPQIVKIFSEDGMGKVVEVPADMTARDLCQLLVYKSHCVDDNSWALVEHHPLLGLGKGRSPAGLRATHTRTRTHTVSRSHMPTSKLMGLEICTAIPDICKYTHTHTPTHAHIHASVLVRTGTNSPGAYSHAAMHSSMSACAYYASYNAARTGPQCP